ncbi:coiled-coil domain-containing protein [Ehrlichia canis]|uniref:hypothetical protein n=1 Tax=Ehrlichia canis TaxID=944 RepID=UPI001F1F39CD|nr:hypothetical protein [Ehrlichia canis]UKC53472.1 hypothetical protein s20019040002_000515 [Ehrlichia canis]UKC54410.1 hypothetical protein s20026770001_000516 [Ehrlichia canis]UKC55347.1 hypothetical protein s21009500007_000517 [Ehrlichia canis]
MDNYCIIICAALVILLAILMAVLFGLLYKSTRDLKRSLESQSKSYNSEIGLLKQSLESLKANIAGLNLQNINSVLNKVNTYDKKLEIIKNDIKGFSSKCNSLETACDTLKKQLISAHGELASLSKKIHKAWKDKNKDGTVAIPSQSQIFDIDLMAFVEELNIMRMAVAELMSRNEVHNLISLEHSVSNLVCSVSSLSDSLSALESERVEHSIYIKNIAAKVASNLDEITFRVSAIERKISDLH